jgi:hypothetical protein
LGLTDLIIAVISRVADWTPGSKQFLGTTIMELKLGLSWGSAHGFFVFILEQFVLKWGQETCIMNKKGPID